MSSDSMPDEPIGIEVPVADAVEQRLPADENRGIAEDFEPTEVSRLAGDTPLDADLADWQDQSTSAAGDWDPDLDR